MTTTEQWTLFGIAMMGLGRFLTWLQNGLREANRAPRKEPKTMDSENNNLNMLIINSAVDTSGALVRCLATLTLPDQELMVVCSGSFPFETWRVHTHILERGAREDHDNTDCEHIGAAEVVAYFNPQYQGA